MVPHAKVIMIKIKENLIVLSCFCFPQKAWQKLYIYNWHSFSYRNLINFEFIEQKATFKTNKTKLFHNLKIVSFFYFRVDMLSLLISFYDLRRIIITIWASECTLKYKYCTFAYVLHFSVYKKKNAENKKPIKDKVEKIANRKKLNNSIYEWITFFCFLSHQ